MELKLVPIDWEALDALYGDPATVPQLHWSVWWAGPDPRSWFVFWRCDSTYDSGEGYCNPALDALLDRADAELDPDRRVALYEEAGRMVVADAPAIFAPHRLHHGAGQAVRDRLLAHDALCEWELAGLDEPDDRRRRSTARLTTNVTAELAHGSHGTTAPRSPGGQSPAGPGSSHCDC